MGEYHGIMFALFLLSGRGAPFPGDAIPPMRSALRADGDGTEKVGSLCNFVYGSS